MRLKGNTKKILAALFVLAILCASFVPAAIVSAAAGTWPLRIEGATAVTINQSQFEALAAAYPVSYTNTTSGNVYAGVALWRLIALVDDGDPTTFNTTLAASGYTIKLSDITNYNGSISSTAFANNDSYFLANTVNGTAWDSTASSYPLKCIAGNTTKGGSAVGGVIKIQLLGLTKSASVSVSPSSQAVANGATFNVNISIKTNTAVKAWGLDVYFNASELTANSVTEGSFLSAYATANGGGTTSGGAATLDNTLGHITIPGYAMTGSFSGGAMGTGTLCTISFTAKTGIDNYSSINIDPASVVIPDYNFATIAGVGVTNGTVAIGDVPMPDLVVSALSTAKVNDSAYNITYTIMNQGNLAAGASTTSITIDGTPITLACPALDLGASDTQTTVNQTVTSGSDTITVTADSAGVVAESHEDNNARTITYALVGANGSTSISGNIAAALNLTVPADIGSWNLIQGSNDITGSANVKCNTNWQLQVNDQDTNTSGHMTKWLAGIYTTSTNLTDPLHVESALNVALSGIPQTIVTGDPA